MIYLIYNLYLNQQSTISHYVVVFFYVFLEFHKATPAKPINLAGVKVMLSYIFVI